MAFDGFKNMLKVRLLSMRNIALISYMEFCSITFFRI